MNKDFLENYYIENELYLMNPPMTTKDFIKFCKNRGVEITEKKLEELEKEDLFYPIFRIQNEFNRRYWYYNFDETTKNKFKKNKTIFIPTKTDFKPFDEYHEKGKGQKIGSYYSSFQIYWLREILSHTNSYTWLKKIKSDFALTIDLLISIQHYSFYGRTNGRVMKVSFIKKFESLMQKFSLEYIFSFYNVDIKYLIDIYLMLCRELPYFLGDRGMIQIWKHINWNKKDKFKGIIRLGIEYMQWTLMLKKCIEDYLCREIFDIDECTTMDAEYILNNEPKKEKEDVRGIRNKVYFNEITNQYEFDLNRKKLYYLANEFDLDYHPRVIIFVEGKTEEKIIKKIFKEFYKTDIENRMIDIINFKGISNFCSREIKNKDENNKYKSTILSNYSHLINYFYENYQVIPFFIGDNENNIINKLKEGIVFDSEKLFKYKTQLTTKEYKHLIEYLSNEIFKIIKNISNEEFKIEDNDILSNIKDYFDETKNLNKKMLDGWTCIWENDFELDNYTSEELTNAINKVCNLNEYEKIKPEEIETLKKENKSKGVKKGIKKLNPKIENNKIEINEELIENLKDKLKENSEEIFERPIFKEIDKIINTSCNLNYPPINTYLANKNKEILADLILRNDDKMFINF